MIRTVGVGQYGRVRLVKSIKTGQLYAMKCLEKQRILDLGQTTHIKNERIVMAQVRLCRRHPTFTHSVQNFRRSLAR